MSGLTIEDFRVKKEPKLTIDDFRVKKQSKSRKKSNSVSSNSSSTPEPSVKNFKRMENQNQNLN